MRDPDILPGSPSGTAGDGIDWPALMAHPHSYDPGRGLVMECPQPVCPARTMGPYELGCGPCFQIGAAEYASHMAIHHGPEVAAAAAAAERIRT